MLEVTRVMYSLVIFYKLEAQIQRLGDNISHKSACVTTDLLFFFVEVQRARDLQGDIT